MINSSMKKFIFDVDGTLTPSRQQIDWEFKLWFNDFQTYYETYIVTGSDKPKTVEQLGPETYNLFHRCYQCQGNDVWVGEKNIKTTNIEIPSAMQEIFDDFLSNSLFEIRTGDHIDIRPGLINFSILGRNASAEERKKYIKWDVKSDERNLIAEMLTEALPAWDIKIAGETGLDIVPARCDKSQILNDFDHNDEIIFFGDNTQFGGNDYEISNKVISSGDISIHVCDWTETWEMLKVMTR